MKKFVVYLVLGLAFNSAAFAGDAANLSAASVQAVNSLTCQMLVNTDGTVATSRDNAVALKDATIFFFVDLSSSQYFVFDQNQGTLLNATLNRGATTAIKWSSGEEHYAVSLVSSTEGELTSVTSSGWHKTLLSCKSH
ncbi:MAG: hypothetical protein NTZ90_00610 [Proteobacteria bacterium]|nr:hypothetical protein [Pseudomonadota bacterium]